MGDSTPFHLVKMGSSCLWDLINTSSSIALTAGSTLERQEILYSDDAGKKRRGEIGVRNENTKDESEKEALLTEMTKASERGIL